VEQTYESLARLRDAGTALLVIEQQVTQALRLCDSVVMLDHGTVSWAGPSADAAQRLGDHLFNGAAT
jgi:branched-chain amino acid transport system ATP-binding protein